MAPALRAAGELALPLGCVAATALLAFLGLRSHVAKHEAAQAARSVYLLLTFVLTFNYTVVILDSYDFSKALGLSEAASGRMVGTYMLGACLGAGAMWLLKRRSPTLWREDPHTLLMAGLLSQLVGSLLYTLVASLVALGGSGERGAGSPLAGLLAQLLMLARFVAGMGSGSCQQFYVSTMLHITPVAERGTHTSRWVFSGMLALGMGPPAAALLQALASAVQTTDAAPRFDLVGYVQTAAAITALLAVARLHPSLDGVKDCLQARESEEERPLAESRHKAGSGNAVLVVGCLLMTGLRAFSVSAIEVGIALRLEQAYGWDQRVTGLVVGAIFLCCIPLRAFHGCCKEAMPVPDWIRVLGGLSVLGGSLLFSHFCGSGFFGATLACAEVLVAAGAVLFPCLYLSDALASGLMHQHVLPEGSLLDANHAQLWFMLLQGLGRFLGPWLARRCLEVYGQDAFAAGQMAATLTFLLTFESLVRPFVARPRDAEREGDCELLRPRDDAGA